MDYFFIHEVSEVVGIAPHVLCFWEHEFPSLAPKRDVKGERVYSSEDVEIVRRIIELLYTEKLSLRGARAQLAKEFPRRDRAF
jgi:DNA-binding transcriptional MerR regulator